MYARSRFEALTDGVFSVAMTLLVIDVRLPDALSAGDEAGFVRALRDLEPKLLAYAMSQTWFPTWKAALPVGGLDGSLTSRFSEAPLKNHVFAKTGTLGESRALSGYLDCASGKQVIFSIMVDDHLPGSVADRVTMDKIVAAIAANE